MLKNGSVFAWRRRCGFEGREEPSRLHVQVVPDCFGCTQTELVQTIEGGATDPYAQGLGRC
jgi:hypothetical protein